LPLPSLARPVLCCGTCTGMLRLPRRSLSCATHWACLHILLMSC
jgi:hypothetical protein